MRANCLKLIAAIVILAVPCFGSVQEKDVVCNATGTPATTCTLTFALGATAGNAIVFGAGWYTSAANIMSVSDDKGDTITLLLKNFISGGAEAYQMGVLFGVTAGAKTFTVTWSGTGSTFSGAAIMEESGVNSLDNQSIETLTSNCQFSGTTGGADTCAAGATHTAPQVAVSFVVDQTSVNWTMGNGFTLRSTATGIQLAMGDQAVGNGTYWSTYGVSISTLTATTNLTLYRSDTSQFVQESDHDDGQSGGLTSDAFPYNVNVASGQFLWDVYAWVNSPRITQTSHVDSLGNTWTCNAVLNLSDGATSAQFCYSFSTHSGADTVTVNFSSTGASFIGMAHGAIANVSAIDASGAGNVQTSGSSSTPSSGTYTTTGKSDIILGWVATAEGFTNYSVGAGWTPRATNYRSIFAETQIGVPVGTYSSAFTLNTGSSVWASGIVALVSTVGYGMQYGATLNGGSIH